MKEKKKPPNLIAFRMELQDGCFKGSGADVMYLNFIRVFGRTSRTISLTKQRTAETINDGKQQGTAHFPGRQGPQRWC